MAQILDVFIVSIFKHLEARFNISILSLFLMNGVGVGEVKFCSLSLSFLT